ncbi:hypothetical protein GPECTOR_8g167 [Gonium pectorale]|uniref:Uncharacterized protein n=1 Tax=Gonium pectorale TaxID=33097 RepID=A0A150GSW2_GONPE|nr:hypothetical protein GPECTOR_8g167 [Gonium pectorale]|eukprot:KXZ52778.1 hypothetical protein GPECTOR_8g167 [Gonium pectorale]
MQGVAAGRDNINGVNGTDKGPALESLWGAEGISKERVLAFLNSVRSLGQQLRSRGDAWLAERAEAVEAAAQRLRGEVQSRGQRLREEIRQRCQPASFTPPTDAPAKIEGPGVSYSLTGESCRLRRLATPVRRDLIFSCTGRGASVERTVPRYTAARTEPATFRATECRTDYRYGLAASVSVDLWQPGQRPQDVIESWRQRISRWREQAAEVRERFTARVGRLGSRRAAGGGGSGGGDGDAGDMWQSAGGGSASDAIGELGLLMQMHAAPAEMLREAFAR